MKHIQEFLDSKLYIELGVTIILFIIAIYTKGIVEVVIWLLYFVILLEVVRAVFSFLREKRIKIRFLMDAFIILVLREFIVNVVKINKENFDSFDAVFKSSTNFHIMIFSGVLIFLFFLRYLSLLTSPDKK